MAVCVGVCVFVGVGVLEAEEEAEELHVEGAVFEYVKTGEGVALPNADILIEDVDDLEELPLALRLRNELCDAELEGLPEKEGDAVTDGEEDSDE